MATLCVDTPGPAASIGLLVLSISVTLLMLRATGVVEVRS